MSNITKLFHVAHVVDDLAEASGGAIYTHPRDSCGLLEFMEPLPDGGYDLRLESGWPDLHWRLDRKSSWSSPSPSPPSPRPVARAD